MKEKKENRKYLTVSEIISLLSYKQYEIVATYRVPDAVLNSGKWVHSRLGYDQTRKFSRYFEADGENWLVVGCPDKLEKGVIEELKTHSSKTVRKDVVERAELQCQIYCWLTGFSQWKVVCYSLWDEKVSKTVKGKYDEKLVNETLKKAILLKKKLWEFQKEYQALLKGGEQNDDAREGQGSPDEG